MLKFLIIWDANCLIIHVASVIIQLTTNHFIIRKSLKRLLTMLTT